MMKAVFKSLGCTTLVFGLCIFLIYGIAKMPSAYFAAAMLVNSFLLLTFVFWAFVFKEKRNSL